jgi:hypothetical protein
LVPQSDQPDLIRHVVPGKADVMRFTGFTRVTPRETWESQWFTVNLSHTAPADDGALHMFSDGVKCDIVYALILDNAGRRWKTRQGKGKPAKRIRWYSRSGNFYPVEWQNPIGRRVRIFKAGLKGRIGSMQKSFARWLSCSLRHWRGLGLSGNERPRPGIRDGIFPCLLCGLAFYPGVHVAFAPS